MENYTLQLNETVLYEDSVYESEVGRSHLILTNLNIVLIITKRISRGLFKKDLEEVYVKTYPISEVKVYNDLPQVKQKMKDVTLYLTSGELEFTFDSALKAFSFVNKTKELLTGNNSAVRGAGKVKKAIGVVDQTLGINTMGTISGVLEKGVGGTLLGGIGKNRTQIQTSTSIPKSEIETELLKDETPEVNQEYDNNMKTQSAKEMRLNLSYEEKIESVKKLKELLDMGIISQDEFDLKKRELLGL